MNGRETIHTTAAPAAIGPYAQAVAAGPYLFASGQIALDPATGQLVDGDAAAQARQVLANVAAVLAAAGLAFADVVKTTIFLTDMADFAARSTVAVAALPRGGAVEIEVVALRR
jgi:2-iminobutanoate/2-iminopropanoate deaminase